MCRQRRATGWRAPCNWCLVAARGPRQYRRCDGNPEQSESELIAVVVSPAPLRLIAFITAVILLAALLKPLWHRSCRVTEAVSYVSVCTIAARYRLAAATVAPVALASSLILRRYHSVWEAASVDVDIISIPALLNLDQRNRLARQRRAKVETYYSSGNAHKHDRILSDSQCGEGRKSSGHVPGGRGP